MQEVLRTQFEEFADLHAARQNDVERIAGFAFFANAIAGRHANFAGLTSHKGQGRFVKRWKRLMENVQPAIECHLFTPQRDSQILAYPSGV